MITFSCKPIKAFNVLKGEPGEYSAWRARSKRGIAKVSFLKALKFFERSRPINKLGLKLGAETKAKTSPVLGSIATIPPLLFCNKDSPYSCNNPSIVRVKSSAGFKAISNAPSL